MTVTSKFASKFALAAVLASAFATSALAGDWRYHGGPKAPDAGASYTEYPDYYAYGADSAAGYAYGPGYGPAYAYDAPAYDYRGGPFVAGAYYGNGWAGPRFGYRDGPATSDYYHRSRQLQGTR